MVDANTARVSRGTTAKSIGNMGSMPSTRILKDFTIRLLLISS